MSKTTTLIKQNITAPVQFYNIATDEDFIGIDDRLRTQAKKKPHGSQNHCFRIATVEQGHVVPATDTIPHTHLVVEKYITDRVIDPLTKKLSTVTNYIYRFAIWVTPFNQARIVALDHRLGHEDQIMPYAKIEPYSKNTNPVHHTYDRFNHHPLVQGEIYMLDKESKPQSNIVKRAISHALGPLRTPASVKRSIASHYLRYPLEVDHRGRPFSELDVWSRNTARERGAVEINGLPELNDALLGSTTVAEFTAALFGDHASRPDLIKAMATASLPCIDFVHALWDESMPIDWVILALRRFTDNSLNFDERYPADHRGQLIHYWQYIHTFYWYNTELRRAIAALDHKSRARLLKRTYTATDMAHIQHAIQNISNIYDDLYTHELHQRHNHLFPVPCDPELRLDLPTQVRTPREWEYQLNANCARSSTELGSYNDAINATMEETMAAWLSTDEGQAWVNSREETERRAYQKQMSKHRNQLARLQRVNAEVHALYTGVTDYLTNLNESADSRLHYTIATTRAQLRTWSQEMSNCIGGYSLDIERTQTMLIAVYRGHRMIANAELRLDPSSPYITQLAGPRNTRVDTSQHKEIMNTLRAALEHGRIDQKHGIDQEHDNQLVSA